MENNFKYPNGYLENQLEKPYFKEHKARIENVNLKNIGQSNKLYEGNNLGTYHNEDWGKDPNSFRFQHAKMPEWSTAPYGHYDKLGRIILDDGKHRTRAMLNSGYESSPMIVYGEKAKYDPYQPVGKGLWSLDALSQGIPHVRNATVRDMIRDRAEELDIPLDYIKSNTPNLNWFYDDGGVNLTDSRYMNSNRIEEGIRDGYIKPEIFKKNLIRDLASGNLDVSEEELHKATPFLNWDDGSAILEGHNKIRQEAEENKKQDPNWEKEALQEFGTTNNFNSAGFMLADGTMLNFGNGYMRGSDHREINMGRDFDEASKGMEMFMKRGNIRLVPESGGINISVEPTYEQWRALAPFIRQSIRNEGEFLVDIDDPDGYSEKSFRFGPENDLMSIINSISQFYKTGL